MRAGEATVSAGTNWLKLLHHLILSPKTPTELANLEKKHLSEISRALAKLRRFGYVEYERRGSKERYYRATVDGYLFLRNAMQATR